MAFRYQCDYTCRSFRCPAALERIAAGWRNGRDIRHGVQCKGVGKWHSCNWPDCPVRSIKRAAPTSVGRTEMTLDENGVHPAVISLVRELHGRGGVWTQEEQAAFFAAFASVIKYTYPAKDQPDAANGERKGEK